MSNLDLDPAWGALGLLHGKASELQAIELDSPLVEGRKAFVALDWEGNRHVLIPMHGELKSPEAGQGNAIRVSTRPLVDGPTTSLFMDVACLKPHLNRLFDAVASDMLTSCGGGTLSMVPVTCRGVLERWRELLEEAGIGHVAGSVIAGAWGELWFVRELLVRGAAFAGLWVGPTGAVHDIHGADGRHLEVKTTASRGLLIIEIHGVHQLESLGDEGLLLGVLRVAHDEDDGESLADLVRSCVSAGAGHADAMKLLAQAGISAAAPEYESMRYSVASRRVYEVDDSFPRIVRSSLVLGDLPPSVVGMSYQIDLTSAAPAPLSESAVEVALLRMAGVQ